MTLRFVTPGPGFLVVCALSCTAGCEKLDVRQGLAADAALADAQAADEDNASSAEDTAHSEVDEASSVDETSGVEGASEAEALPPPTPSCRPSQNNLVDNPDFADDIEGWSEQAGDVNVAVEHDDRSFDGARGSGSLALHLEPGGNPGDVGQVGLISGAVQCLPVHQESRYSVAALYQVDDDGATAATASLTVFFHEEADCSDPFVGVWSSLEGSSKKAWRYLLGEFETTSETRAVELRLNVNAPAGSTSATVLYDEVYLSTDPLCSTEDTPQAPEDDSDTEDDTDDDSETARPSDSIDAALPVSDDDTRDDDGETSSTAPTDGGDFTDPHPTDPGPTQSETDPDPTDSEPTADPSEPAGPSYAETVEPIVLAKCVNACHEPDGVGGPGALEAVFGALDLSEGNGYDSLTNGASSQVDLSLVGATLEESYVWHKLNDTQASVGSSDTQKMPLPPADGLSADELEAFEAWISGAGLP